MRPILTMAMTAATLAAVTGAAQARAYPSCGQAQAIVAARGAAVIHTAPNIYDRYVAHAGFCFPTQYAKPTFAATRDNPYCPIGAICVEREGGRRWRR